MGYLNWFEESRFIVELMLAEWIFLIPFAARRKHFIQKAVFGFSAMIALAVLFVPLHNCITLLDSFWYGPIAFLWYMTLTLLTILLQKASFKIAWCDLMYIGVCSYTLQHIDFILINELLGIYIWPWLQDVLLFYALLCAAGTAVIYGIVHHVFTEKLRECRGSLYQTERKNTVFLMVYFFFTVVVLFCQQTVFQFIDIRLQALGVFMDLITCILILFVQYSILRISELNREQGMIGQLMYERQKQYASEKGNIDIINRKCHDLKHQITALRSMKNDDRNQYIEEVENAVLMLDTFAKTDNEILNTIITNKGMYCEKQQIRFSVVADGKQLNFMKDMDIYALIGNALDNAIECVEKYDDREQRVISLVIARKGNFLCIQIENYCYDQMNFRRGIPVTTKEDKGYHGFGMKSMKYIVEQYGGTMTIDYKDHIFILQMLIPIPEIKH